MNATFPHRSHRLPLPALIALLAVALVHSSAFAQYDPPASYYSSVGSQTGSALKSTLHNIIDDHTKRSYSYVWGALETLDQDPSNSTRVLCIYSNQSIPKADRDGSSSATPRWNREHSWPKSYGFDTESWPAYTDLHHLFACDQGYNSSRNNKYYDNSVGTNYPVTGSTDVNSADTDSWEPWDEVKGDLARAMFYMAVRYNGDKTNEPDLELFETGPNVGEPRMAKLSTLLAWHNADPVSDRERRRNHLIYTSYQFNRNPFIDHPEWVCAIWGGDCSGSGGGGGGGSTGGPLTSGVTVDGNVPQGTWHHYTISVGASAVELNVTMTGTNDADLYVRRTSQPTTTTYDYRSNGGTSSEGVVATTSSSPALVPGSTYYVSVYGYSASGSDYMLTATVVNGSGGGGGGGGSANVWINEFHYDNDGADTNEFVEVAGAAGTNLSGWSLVAYNGGDGAAYKTVNLSGTIPNQQNGYGVLSFAFTGLQNGAPDGIALANGTTLVEFISYEGTMTASSGVASGQSSTNVVVSETSTTPAGQSLRRSGTGTTGSAFAWQAPATASPGSINAGQTFGAAGGGGGGTPPPTGSLTSGQTVSGSLAQGAWVHHTIYVPAGKTSLVVQITGGGDADLYVRRGSQPTLSAYDFRPWLNGSTESVTVNGSSSPTLVVDSMYHVSVYGYSAGTTYNLTATAN